MPSFEQWKASTRGRVPTEATFTPLTLIFPSLTGTPPTVPWYVTLPRSTYATSPARCLMKWYPRKTLYPFDLVSTSPEPGSTRDPTTSSLKLLLPKAPPTYQRGPMSRVIGSGIASAFGSGSGSGAGTFTLARRLNAVVTRDGRSAALVRVTSAPGDLITAAEPGLNWVPVWWSRATTEPWSTLRKAPSDTET